MKAVSIKRKALILLNKYYWGILVALTVVCLLGGYLFFIKDKLAARKDRLRKQLVATRFDQYKRDAALQEGTKNDNANLQAELALRLRKLEDLTKGK